MLESLENLAFLKEVLLFPFTVHMPAASCTPLTLNIKMK